MESEHMHPLQAALEPPWLLRHRVALAKWKPVLDALEDVMLQTSAMESVLEGQGDHTCMLLLGQGFANQAHVLPGTCLCLLVAVIPQGSMC